jgi:thymidine kinase
MFANRDKVVIVAGLDGTFQRKPFGSILELIPIAEKVMKLSAVCMYCSKDAPFTLRTVDNCEV